VKHKPLPAHFFIKKLILQYYLSHFFKIELSE